MAQNQPFQAAFPPRDRPTLANSLSAPAPSTFVPNSFRRKYPSGRVARACQTCRRKKIKCSGDNDCQPCRELGLICPGVQVDTNRAFDSGSQSPQPIGASGQPVDKATTHVQRMSRSQASGQAMAIPAHSSDQSGIGSAGFEQSQTYDGFAHASPWSSNASLSSLDLSYTPSQLSEETSFGQSTPLNAPVSYSGQPAPNLTWAVDTQLHPELAPYGYTALGPATPLPTVDSQGATGRTASFLSTAQDLEERARYLRGLAALLTEPVPEVAPVASGELQIWTPSSV